tara:strand:- start:2534 stop:3157 length:624 start_codon:yes stop_codon:yes gene_type:complete
MEFVDKVLTEEDLHQIYYSGDLKRLYLGSKGFFNKGTYKYPGLDLTPEEIANAGDENHTAHWYNKCLDYVLTKLAFGMYKDGYLVNIALGFMEDGAWHLCNTLIGPDNEGTRAFMRNPEYHNTRGTTEKNLGATISYSYCDVGSPINDTFIAYKNYFGPIEECNVKNYNTMTHLGQVTQNYSTGGQDWPGIESEYSVVFEKYSLGYY